MITRRIIETITFQSTPPARGATMPLLNGSLVVYISIHAPREGGDTGGKFAVACWEGISIHAPREGGDRIGPRQA